MGKTVRVLVGEDSHEDQLLLARAFQRACVHARLDFLPNGQEVIEYLQDPLKPQPALLIVDCAMTKVCGLEVLAWLRGTGTCKDLPVVVLTGQHYQPHALRAQELGATYALKPVDPDELDSMVLEWNRQYLAEHETESPQRAGLHAPRWPA